ncbi:MAG: protein-glutamate O-methyltransferase CheR [Paludibacter sp.]|nr:protein-glutamate O-methyltransferase CheR [Paludibacter sp.]
MKEKLGYLTEFMLIEKGIDVLRFDETFLLKSLQKRMDETQCSVKEDYYRLLEQNGEESDEFLNSLQISYSEFFRNPLTFSVLEKIVLPSLAIKKGTVKRHEIRIWSAACSGGQESYSLSMLLNEFNAGKAISQDFRIFATDISESHLGVARKGQYPRTALNMITLKRLNEWFSKKGDMYSVKSQLKENIDFSVFDLLNPDFSCPPASIFGDFDIVFCANLLFYFKPEFRTKILNKISHCMADGGYLITGETEREILMQNNYQEIFPQSAIFRKV